MTGNSRRWLPAAVVVVAVAALSVAARRTGGLDAGPSDGLWRSPALRSLGALIATAVLVSAAVRFAKHRDDGYGPLRRAGTATAVLLAVAAVATPIGLFFFGRVPTDEQPPVSANDQVSGTPPTPPVMPPGKMGKGGHNQLVDLIVTTVLYLVTAAAIGLIIYGLYRLLHGRRLPRLGPGLEITDLVDADLEQLADAVAAGSKALAYRGDAREAVIACYAAMENALGADGHGRREADTPEDFLQRVTGARLIPAEPARRLTDLFREARFSRHPVEETQRDQARAALEAIAEHLRARAAEAQAAAAARAEAAAAESAQQPESAGAAGGAR